MFVIRQNGLSRRVGTAEDGIAGLRGGQPGEITINRSLLDALIFLPRASCPSLVPRGAACKRRYLRSIELELTSSTLLDLIEHFDHLWLVLPHGPFAMLPRLRLPAAPTARPFVAASRI
jgi:hypothetical protein